MDTKISKAVVIIVQKKNKIACLHSNKRQAWELPGGKIDIGETIKNAAMREASEETGLDIIDVKLIGRRKDDSGITCYLYKAIEFSGDLKSSEEGTIKWYTPKQFLKLKQSYSQYINWALDKNEEFNRTMSKTNKSNKSFSIRSNRKK